MKLDENARYLESHEWARKEGDEIVIGISDYAQQPLTDIVYVELPDIDDEIVKDEPFIVVESVKAASDVIAPMSGVVVAVNEALEDAPEVVNEDPFGDGWMIRIEPSNPDEWGDLLTPAAYKKVVEEEEAAH